MIELIIGIVGGGVISWIISSQYYKKSNTFAPDWAIPLIDKLPRIALSEKELLRLFQEEIENGTITPHPVFMHVACPNCHAPIDELIEKISGDDYHTILDLSCPHCGWSDWAEV